MLGMFASFARRIRGIFPRGSKKPQKHTVKLTDNSWYRFGCTFLPALSDNHDD